MSGLAPPNSLSYTGQVAVPSINRTFPPTTAFNDFNVPTIWTDTRNANAYILVAKPVGVADWILIGGGPGTIATITGDTGGAVPPMAANINILAATSGLSLAGNAGTATLTLGGTLNVAHGGTGDTSFTPYAVICGGTTSTAPLQSIASVGTAGQALVSNGAGALPTFQAIGATGAFSQVSIRVFTSLTPASYTPTANTKYVIVECQAGGGGSGGVGAPGVGQIAVSGGGGGGGYARKFLTVAAATGQTMTIGAGGVAGTNAPGDGGTGGTTSFGALCVATGGTGNVGVAAATLDFTLRGEGAGFGGIGTTGDLLIRGTPGYFGCGSSVSGQRGSGAGGGSYFGSGGQTSSQIGNAGGQYGGGASGSGAVNGSGAIAGAAGAQGVIVVTEFI